MTIPGTTDGMNDAALMEKADDEAEKLLEELKEKVKVDAEDIGTLRKKLSVTVPEEVIINHLDHNFNELRSDAVVPGFRKGHAPIQLVQKRYGADVRDSLKTSILGQSYFAAVENQELEVLGDPMLNIDAGDGEKLMEVDEALQHIKLPEKGDFRYACEVEIKPTFELPDLEGIKIKAPKIKILKKDVDEHIDRQLKIRGRLEPVVDGKAEKDDTVVAKVVLTVDGNVIKEEDNVEFGVRGTRLDGVMLENLGETLAGAKPGDTVSTECNIPDDYERTDARGKSGKFEFTIHELKRLNPIDIKALIEQNGAESEKEFREFVKDDMEAERDRMVEQAKKEQVLAHLLEKTELDLPDQLSAKQTDRAVLRKVVDLQQRGVPQGEIEAHIDELRTTAQEEVARNLKLDFIMEKVAEKLEVDVTDEEVNTEIARMAQMYNQRFDRVRDSLHARGLLSQLAEQIRQDKCVTRLIADAQIEEVSAAEKKKTTDKDAEKKK